MKIEIYLAGGLLLLLCVNIGQWLYKDSLDADLRSTKAQLVAASGNATANAVSANAALKSAQTLADDLRVCTKQNEQLGKENAAAVASAFAATKDAESRLAVWQEQYRKVIHADASAAAVLSTKLPDEVLP